ncbi:MULTISPECIES: ABC transporter permease [unclassified Streptomyces]|uniref:ABC transporter permease n=1 Tax=unclassified Streptomyces TaxID=2593676 RepID=UPI00225C39C2|nr:MULTISPECIES: ABC transporter permease [unclassified Streptomyces]MCX5143892.1 ABC transporter permease [Streptomyces sp. NBC_00338]
MRHYLARRLLQAVMVLWAAFTLSFALLYLLPGDPVEIMAGGGAGQSTVDPARIAELRASYGLDKPLAEQYVNQLLAVVHGDFGQSVASGTPVSGIIGAAVPPTAQLMLVALPLAVLAGAGLALAATYTRNRRLSALLLSAPPFGVSVPAFWVGLLLIQLFSFRLRLFPATGDEGAASLVLPAVTIALPAAAAIAQVLARSLRGTLSEPYITTALAKGASRARVHLRHATRNASLPALTVVGLLTGELLTNAVVVETVFSRAGLGRVTVTAVGAKDIPVVQAVVVLTALVVVTVNLLVDLIHPVLDPRAAGRVNSGPGAGSAPGAGPGSRPGADSDPSPGLAKVAAS